ncbi:hypothetical protein RHGRI_034268 [Rhododendron griersonianum]|uniref:DNAJC9 HTH domain-containing protein n=2 Tax=Rhododendron griersonianum TaxID=479676 RepID=A0AAV6I0C6_9ERIC|nr:hypothetical protein RHGRI_034268 [Rhododendron griersonianum]KAG5521989.1 hypothetical protein RHGRI_034268 [Rhododendron griersonianum]
MRKLVMLNRVLDDQAHLASAQLTTDHSTSKAESFRHHDISPDASRALLCRTRSAAVLCDWALRCPLNNSGLPNFGVEISSQRLMLCLTQDRSIFFPSERSVLSYINTLVIKEPSIVTEANIEEFEANYRGSDYDKNDLIELYNKYKGHMNRLFCSMLCSDPKLDSQRFKNILDKAITSGEIMDSPFLDERTSKEDIMIILLSGRKQQVHKLLVKIAQANEGTQACNVALGRFFCFGSKMDQDNASILRVDLFLPLPFSSTSNALLEFFFFPYPMYQYHGTKLEAIAASTIAQRGIQLVATAHGVTIENLIMNPSLGMLVGGIQSVTLGDEEASRRGVQKTILERKGPSTFSCGVEIISKTELRVHRNLEAIVDAIRPGIFSSLFKTKSWHLLLPFSISLFIVLNKCPFIFA